MKGGDEERGALDDAARPARDRVRGRGPPPPGDPRRGANDAAARMRRVWHSLRRRSPVFRKLTSLAKRVPRFTGRLAGTSRPGFSLLANSFPKSGTHLLVQILEAFPGVVNYETFLASLPSTRLSQRSDGALLKRIGRIARGELVSAHLFHKAIFRDRLLEQGCVIYFIYRDPRDVVVSAAHYLAGMNRWNRAHRHFARLADDDERILRAIRGLPDGGAEFDFPDVAERFAAYEGWLHEPAALAVRYEDLLHPATDETLRRMVRFFVERTGLELDEDRVVQAARANIDPAKSRTFRSGRVGGWRESFTARHRSAMKEVAGDLLVRLGYETDLDW